MSNDEQMTYEQYLASPLWKKKRQEALDRYGAKCGICGSTDRIQVHHLSYDRIMDEDVSDLMPLCHECHEKVTMLLDAFDKTILDVVMSERFKKAIAECKSIMQPLCDELAHEAAANVASAIGKHKTTSVNRIASQFYQRFARERVFQALGCADYRDVLSEASKIRKKTEQK